MSVETYLSRNARGYFNADNLGTRALHADNEVSPDQISPSGTTF